jgi:hypothetical protein
VENCSEIIDELYIFLVIDKCDCIFNNKFDCVLIILVSEQLFFPYRYIRVHYSVIEKWIFLKK